MTLRADLIEAGLEVYNHYRNGPMEDFEDSSDFIAQTLDAMLDKLEQHADDRPFKIATDLPLRASRVTDLIAVLREEP